MNFLEVIEHHVLDHAMHVGALPMTKHALMLAVAALLLAVFLPILAYRWPLVPAGSRALLESVVLFVRDDIVVPNAGDEGLVYLPYFLTLFFFVLLLNLLGMIPGFATATSNISVTATLALFSFGLIVFAGIREHSVVGFLKTFIPPDIPGWLVPFMVPLEMFALVTRTIALCIRLFANMIAGHIVILTFVSLVFIFRTALVGIVSVPAAVALSCLEVFVALLQAYIFTLLTSVFVGAVLHPH